MEVEKTERKNIPKCVRKFERGYVEHSDGRPKVEFGCLVVPVNYAHSGHIFDGAKQHLLFAEKTLEIGDVLLIGYRDPR